MHDTETSKLRRILDERSTEYEALRDGLTIVRADNITYSFHESMVNGTHGMFATAATELLSPKQLAYATLGSYPQDTCQMVQADWGCICTICCGTFDNETGNSWNYCPRCGRPIERPKN